MSHRHPIPSWIKKVFTLLTIPMISGSPLGWAAVHRTHHANEDTENDPHSPLFNSIWWIHFLSITYQPKSIRLIVDLLKDSFQVKFHRIYVYVCLAWIVGLFIILSVDYFAFFVALPSTVTWHLGSAINSIGHSKKLLGPTNRNWLSLITFGEGSHKNHHEDPKSLRFNKNSLLDFGGFILSKIRSK